MLLMIDNYDSFTWNLVQYFGELGEDVRTVRNDAISLDGIAALAPERIVISPGPCTPNEAGISLPAIRRFAGSIPILGVCLGHQVLANALGGQVVVGHPDGTEEGAVALELLPAASEDPVLGALSGEVVVAQSHHDVVVRLPEGAVELARTARYGNQAFRLGSSWGVQFHPEATPELIEDWSRRSVASLAI